MAGTIQMSSFPQSFKVAVVIIAKEICLFIEIMKYDSHQCIVSTTSIDIKRRAKYPFKDS
jgi:hypothetical protein